MDAATVRARLDAVLDHLIIRFDDGRFQAAARQTLLFAVSGQVVGSHRQLLEVLGRMSAEPKAFDWFEGWYRDEAQYRRIKGMLNVLAIRTEETQCRCLVSLDSVCTSERLFLDARRALQVLFTEADAT